MAWVPDVRFRCSEGLRTDCPPEWALGRWMFGGWGGTSGGLSSGRLNSLTGYGGFIRGPDCGETPAGERNGERCSWVG